MIEITGSDAGYPSRLRDMTDAPDRLWVEGDPASLSADRAVAIVGTRRMTPYGARVARELAEAAASAGVVVVSGLAQGIDTAAHEGALAADGRTVAVLGEGLDAWRASARGRRARIGAFLRRRGALVSTYPPDACAKGWMFAKRNAVIAALADAVVVVEAPVGSGALITATDAMRLRRPLFGVPGPLGASTSAGANALIASGRAALLDGPRALLAALGLSTRTQTDRDASPILDALAGGPCDTDALATATRTTSTAIVPILARLLLRGAVRQTSDGRWCRS